MDKQSVVGGARRRREHSAEFKRELVARSLQPGVSVAAIAMEGGVNANLLFGWRRKHLDGLTHGKAATAIKSPGTVLLPVSIEAAPEQALAAPQSHSVPCASPMRTGGGGTIEIELGGSRVRLRGAVDEANLRTVLAALRGLA